MSRRMRGCGKCWPHFSNGHNLGFLRFDLADRKSIEGPQLFYLNTEIVAKQGSVYFDGGGKASFYCIWRDRWKNLRDRFGL